VAMAYGFNNEPILLIAEYLMLSTIAMSKAFPYFVFFLQFILEG
jgi:hypothetical protein